MRSRKETAGYPPLYVLSALFFIMALAGIAVLISTDIIHHLSFSTLHARLDAWPLIMIGLSQICVQFTLTQNRGDQLKSIFLGIAFLLWGGEQLLPQSWISTLMDEGAVTIFVVDLSLIIWSRISLNDVSHLP